MQNCQDKTQQGDIVFIMLRIDNEETCKQIITGSSKTIQVRISNKG